MLTTRNKPVRRKGGIYRSDNWAYISMLLPTVILLLMFNYLPMAGLLIAFERFIPAKGLFSGSQDWVGLRSFSMAFTDPLFPQALRNTVFLSISKMILYMMASVGMAILMSELKNSFHKRLTQTLVYIPHFISWIILGSAMRMMFASDGIVNRLINSLGGENVGFLTEPGPFSRLLIVSDVWKEFGFGTIIYMAAIAGIDPGLYEAARIDGANKPQQIRYVTIPGISHIIVILSLLNIGGVLNSSFDQIINLYSPNVYQSGDVLDTLIYRKGIVASNYSLATAIGMFKGGVGLALTSLAYYLAYRFADYRIF
ncbi:MAG: sugar ABC transporter permease [Clostridia bacterium]|nr:sugar ABC transporter permease [Clostridia bacterium]